MYISYQRFCIEWHLANFVFNASHSSPSNSYKGFEHLTLPEKRPAGLGDIFQKLWVITALKMSNEMVLYIRNKLKTKVSEKKQIKSSEIFTIDVPNQQESSKGTCCRDRGWARWPFKAVNPLWAATRFVVICGIMLYIVVSWKIPTNIGAVNQLWVVLIVMIRNHGESDWTTDAPSYTWSRKGSPLHHPNTSDLANKLHNHNANFTEIVAIAEQFDITWYSLAKQVFISDEQAITYCSS